MPSRRIFLNAIGDERALLNQALTLLAEQQNINDQTVLEVLDNIRTRHGSNMATAAFYQYLLQHDQHGQFVDAVRNTELEGDPSHSLPQMVIVAGMFADTRPELGGDGALLYEIAASLGFDVSIAPTDGRASLEENAATLHDYLAKRDNSDFWLVSISRGSSDVKRLFHQYPDAACYANLRQWVSVCGIVTGSPLVIRIANQRINSGVMRGMSRLAGLSPDLPAQLDPRSPHWSIAAIESSIGITHVMPVPLDWHVTSAVQARYQRLRKSGPTDGLCLLTDVLQQSGHIYPIWGSDHMLRVPHLAEHLYRLINFLVRKDNS